MANTNLKSYLKPPEAKFSIALNPNGSTNTKNLSFQQLMQQLDKHGRSSNFQLHKSEVNNSFSLVGIQHGEILAGKDNIHSVLAFVILENAHGNLELILGLGNHRDVANNAKAVKAAGDVYFAYNKALGTSEIAKIDDRSSGYYVLNTDPEAAAKKNSAKAAMQAVGLPMDKFVPFVLPTTLLFSSGLKPKSNQLFINATPDKHSLDTTIKSPS